MSVVFDFLKAPIHSYYDQLSPSEQASFTGTFSTTLEQCFSGCIPVPQIDSAGWIYDWQVMMPTDASAAPKGGGRIMFANGIQYIYGSPVDDTALQLTGTTENQDVWKLAATTKSGLNVFADGSFSNVFTNEQIGVASEVWISGTGRNYTVTADSKNDNAAPTHFIYINGPGNTVAVECDNNFIYVASGNGVTVKGNNSHIYAEKSTTVIFETTDPASLAGSTLINEVTGETWTTDNDGIAHSSANDSSAFLFNPGRNIFWFDDSGKTTAATQVADGRTYHFTYDVSGLLQEQLIIGPTGGYTQIFYNYPGGISGRPRCLLQTTRARVAVSGSSTSKARISNILTTRHPVQHTISSMTHSRGKYTGGHVFICTFPGGTFGPRDRGCNMVRPVVVA